MTPESTSKVTDESISAPPEPIDYGYDSDLAMLFEAEFRWDFFGTPGQLLELVDAKEYDIWSDQFSHVSPIGKRDPKELNLFTFIQEFDIPREDVVALMSFDGNTLFTNDEIDALYDTSGEALVEQFANPYAIIHGGKIYTPQWILTHESADYKQEGLDENTIEEKRAQWEKEGLFYNHIGKPQSTTPYNPYEGFSTLELFTTNFDIKWDVELDEFCKEFLEFEDIAVSLAGKDAYQKWLKDFGVSRDIGEYNIITFVREFKIDRADFNKATADNVFFTSDVKNALYSDDSFYLRMTFANPYALNRQGDIYTIEWLLTREAWDYKKSGVTADEFETHLSQLESKESALCTAKSTFVDFESIRIKIEESRDIVLGGDE